MSITATISGVAVSVGNASFTITDPLEDRSVLTFTVLDSSGTASYSRGQPVTFVDPGIISYTGYVQSDQPTKDGLSLPYVEHVITCMDGVYSVDKRSNSTNYLNWLAGNIVIDFVQTTLQAEGITIAAAMDHDTTATDFNQGNLNGTSGVIITTNGISDDGDLELTTAGSTLTITENTTAAFNAGTLTNMQAINNTLVPTTVNALKMQSSLSYSYGTEFAQAQQTASGAATGTATGTASGTVNSSGSYTPSGSVFISGGNPGETASFSGFSGTVSSSGSASLPISATVSASVSAAVSQYYSPKLRTTVSIDGLHYNVTLVDKSVADNRVDAVIWTGSMIVGSNDTLNYDIWISSSSPSQEGGVDLLFSDGTLLTQYIGTLGSNNDTGIWDQNDLSVSPIQDLSDAAKDTWYTRQINLSLVAGKTITGVTMFNAANVAGYFDLYVKNCYLGSQSGSPFFGITSTAPAVNPPTVTCFGAYVASATLMSVVPVFVPVASSRVSPAYSIDSVKMVQSSVLSWTEDNPVIGPSVIPNSNGAATVAGKAALFVSYDGTTWLPCTNGQALPGLPAGATVAGVSLYLLETFSGGQDPTAIPYLSNLTITIYSAVKASTTDVVAQYGNSTAWNSGTKLGVAPNSNGDLALSGTSYSWSNTNNMTYSAGNVSSSNPTQSVSGGAYIISSPSTSGGEQAWSSSRFNFISAAQNFTAEADFTLTCTSPGQNEIGFVYRQTYWGSPNNAFAYYVRIMQNPGGNAGGTSVTIGYGINNQPGGNVGGGPASGTWTVISQSSQTITSGTTYHVKLVVSQNRHTIYWNNGTTPIIDVLDNTYTAAGNLGIRTYSYNSSSSATNKVANFSITNTYAGLWTSPSISLSSLGNCGYTQVSWAETTPPGNVQAAALVRASLDGGTTWQQCTNGATTPTANIPGLTPGTSVSGKSLLLQITLSASTYLGNPIITGLRVHVCGAFPSTTGTRDTTPLGNDTQITRTVGSGWGNAFDGQAWTQVGTGTTAVATGEETIANTTGDVHMVLGSRTYTDEEGTMRFALSASGIQAGMELRYTNANNYYRLAASTTGLSIIKNTGGGNITLATASVSLTTGTFYWMRFRVTGAGPVTLQGKVWPYGQLEPGVNLGYLSATAPMWTVVASD